MTAFAVGVALLLASLIPLLRLPNVPVRSATTALADWRLIADAWQNRSMRFLLIHNWWLAFSNGLTQAAFFSFLFGPLGIKLGTFYVLYGVMRIVKIPVSWFAGGMCDRFGNKAALFWGVLIASSAMLFWLAATPEQWWWIFGAFFLWGAFAAVNIAGRNLTLKLSPRSDNSAQLALFRQVGGLLAGLSGLLGGVCLDRLLQSKPPAASPFLLELGAYRFEGYQLLFLISLVGRVTSAFWILPIQEPGAKNISRILKVLRRHRQIRRNSNL